MRLPIGALMLQEQIEKEYIDAYKAKDATTVRVLRLVKSAIKNLHVELLRAPTEEELQTLIIKQTKQRKDSIEQYRSAKREDLARIEEEELVILQKYLPEPITGEALQKLIEETVVTLNLTGVQNMGTIMNHLSTHYSGRIDGKEASMLVRSALQK